MCRREGRGEGEGGKKLKGARRQECVGFKKVQSDDLQCLTHFMSTFTEAGEGGGNPAPLFSPPDIPHYLHTAFEAEMSSWEQGALAAACHWPGGGNLQSLLLYPRFGHELLGDAPATLLPPASCRA